MSVVVMLIIEGKRRTGVMVKLGPGWLLLNSVGVAIVSLSPGCVLRYRSCVD